MEQIRKLINAIKNDPETTAEEKKDDLEFIASRMEKFTNYVNSVVTMEYKMPILMALKEGEDLRDAISSLDDSRRKAHDVVIGACNQLNRMCEIYGLEKFCDIDTEDRYQVADFVGKTVSEIYFEGISEQPNLDKIVAEVQKTGKLLDKKNIEDLER